MRLGMYLDMRNPPGWPRPPARHYGRWLERIEEAERLGAEAVWLTEHHFFDDGYLPQCWTFAAAIAARTSTVRIGTAVSLLPLHGAVDLAEQIALVDILSDGRAEPGFGLGYRRPEYVAFGGEYKRRYDVFSQRIDELRERWGEHEGGLNRVTPAPVQAPLPLWGGFNGPRGARLAGRLGMGLQSLDVRLLESYQQALAASGHEPATARMGGPFEFLVSDDPERAWGLIGEHATYRWESYNRHLYTGTRREGSPPQAGDPDAIGGRVEIGTAEHIASVIRQRTAGLPVTDIYGWSDFPGVPDEVVDEHLHRAFTELAPLLRDGGAVGPPPEPAAPAT